MNPISDKFPHLSTFNYADNNPILNIDLHGLQGLHYMEAREDGTQRHVIEKNIVVLTGKTIPIPENASENQRARIERKNARIESSNKSKLNEVKKELESYFNGSGENATNSKNESVFFKFNIIEERVENTATGDGKINKISYLNGLLSSEKNIDDSKKVVGAAVFSTASAQGNRGLASGNHVITRNDQPLGNGALAHEIGHTLMTRSGKNAEHTSSGLMSISPSFISKTTVDKILEDSYKKY